jgi:hypothetical protein
LLLNELAQWAALVFVAVLLLGLLRQLGDFLVPPRERLAFARGPKLGRGLPDGLLREAERLELLSLMTQRGTGWAAMVVVDEDCPRCATLIERLKEAGAPASAPVVALSSSSGTAHRALLESAADLVVVDAERLERAGLDVSPFILIVNQGLELRHKEIGWDLGQAVTAWRDGQNGEPGVPGEDGAEATVRVVQMEGSQS